MFVLFVGAMIYDPIVINTIIQFLGYKGTISQVDCIKLPIILNQISAFFVLIHALRFRETWTQSEKISDSLERVIQKSFYIDTMD